jgi:hypothetical protein
MTMLKLSVPDDLMRRVKARLGEKGKANVEEYLLSVMEALTMDGEPIDAETEAKLLEGIDSPRVKMTDSDWRRKLRRYDTKHRKVKRA